MSSVCMFVTNSVTVDPRVQREASSLVQAGYAVTVVGIRTDADQAYREVLQGITVLRVTHPKLILSRVNAMLGSKRFPRSASDASFPDDRNSFGLSLENPRPQSTIKVFLRSLVRDTASILNMVLLNIGLVVKGWNVRADIVHAHDLDTLLAAWVLSALRGKKLIYDFHEVYTEQYRKEIKGPIWKGWYRFLEWALARKADLLLTICHSAGEWMSTTYRVPAAVIVKNVPYWQEVSACEERHLPPVRILFHGKFFPDRGLECLVESARYLERGHIILRGLGPLEERLRRQVKEQGLEDVVSIVPPVPMGDLVRMAAKADIGVIPYLPICLNNRICLPNKLFEYMMAGLAVVAGDLPEMRKLIVHHHVGALFQPDDPRDLARVLNTLTTNDGTLREMKVNASSAARNIFNWEKEQDTLLCAYETLGFGKMEERTCVG